MAEIVNLHIAAWEAGLDPNEMDGGDWEGFMCGDSTEPMFSSVEDAADSMRVDMHSWFQFEIKESSREGDTLNDIISRLFPKASPGQVQGFISFIELAGSMPSDDD